MPKEDPIIKTIKVPSHVLDDDWVCHEGEKIAQKILHDLMRRVAKDRQEWWNTICELAGYEGLRDVQRRGHKIEVNWLAGIIEVRDASERLVIKKATDEQA